METFKKLDISSIDDISTIYIIGRRGSGKTFLMRDIMYHKKYLSKGKVISGAQSDFFKEFINETDVYKEFDDKSILNDRHNLFLIFDDCIYDKDSRKNILNNEKNNLQMQIK